MTVAPPSVEAAAAAPSAATGWRGAVARLADERFAASAGVVALAALVVRLVLARFEPLPPSRTPFADEVWYVRVAHNVLLGRGFTSPYFPYRAPTALHAPLTVILLLPAGLLEPYGYTAQRSTMAIVGALAVLAIAFAAKELAGPRVGLVAGALAAVYPGLWVNDLVATSESPAVLLLATTLLLALRYRREPTGRRLVLLGLLVGLLALTRAELSILGLLLVVPTVLATTRASARRVLDAVRSLAVVGVLAVAVVAPWTAYNAARFHQFVPVSTDLGQTLLGANCPPSYYGPLTGYDSLTCWEPVFAKVIREHPHNNEAQYDGYFRQAAVSYAVHHWHRWPIVAVMREAYLWSLWRPGETVLTSAYYLGRADWISWAQIAGFWLLTPFAVYGFVLARRRRLPRWQLVTMVAFAAAVGMLITPHLRYRIPAEIAWVLLGAVALDRILFGAPGAERLASTSDETVSVGGGDLDLR